MSLFAFLHDNLVCFQDYPAKKAKKRFYIDGTICGKITFMGGREEHPGFVGEEGMGSPRESIFLKTTPVFLPDKLVYFYTKNEKNPIFA